MPIEVKRHYLIAIRERYEKGTKKEKGLILNEFCSVCKYTRKYAIKILNGRVNPRENKPGPKPKYDSEVTKHLVVLWKSMNEICSKKMKPAISIWLPFYPDAKGETRSLLEQVSPSTIDRLLKPYKAQHGLSTTTSPSAWMKSKIPIQLLDHDVVEPGFIEADTVAHCGNTVAGKFVSTLTMTDLYSGWTENRAVMTKKAEKVLEGVKSAERAFPFVIKCFASDNGSEFLNELLYGYFENRLPDKVKFVRRRAYKKNDNAHVEQKNFTHVREIFGYERYEADEIQSLMNDIYENYWNKLQNFFIPNLKLKEKMRIGGRLKKRYEGAKTPYQRLQECETMNTWAKVRLHNEFSKINPFTLKAELDRKLNFFWRIVEIEKRKLTGS